MFHRFFDTSWYLQTYPDLRDYPGSAQEHYLSKGYAERRSPHPFFDLGWYLTRHPEIAFAGVEPLSHYFASGWRRLESPHPMFDVGWYLRHNLDLVSADVDPIRHYLDFGWRERRVLHPLFDPEWYLAQNDDVAAADIDPLTHFLQHGWREGRDPHPLFDVAWYMNRFADIRNAKTNPWLHYITSGWIDGLSPHPRFDARWYQESFLDSVTPVCEPLAHYLEFGWREGLRPSSYAPVASVQGDVAPLLAEARAGRRKRQDQPATALGHDETRGILVMVLHQAEVGGAPHVVRQFAQWVRDHTRFGVRLVAIAGGDLADDFAEVAPLLVLKDMPRESRADILKDWLGENVRGVLINSIASGGFLRDMPPGLPTVAFIHELPEIMDQFPDEIALVRQHAQRIIGGGPDVTRELRERYGFAPDRLFSAYSFIEDLPDDADMAARRARARADLDVPDDRVLVLGCGVMHARKSPKTFVAVAEQVLAQGIDAEFVWFGDGHDRAACEALVFDRGLEGRVRFPGHEPALAEKMAGGDIFMLSSREDPFPLVALYAAQAGIPIVCFQKAGGIEGFVAAGSGKAVPHMDVGAMAKAVCAFALNPEARVAAGQIGRRQVRRTHTISGAGPLLLHHMRQVMDLAPEVSVVVPNYNYATYLPERLASIANQTFQDFELILLDDASPDGSVALLEDFAATRAGTRLVVNQTNSGSPFAQWIKGMEMANADLIWLAEADDRCSPEYLRTMLPFFDDRNVRIASCASRPITADGESLGDYRPIYLDRINPGRWNADYVATDHAEANAGLGIANSIPNASAVMLRKFAPEPEFVAEVTSMHLCGDWYFYCRAMRGGLVGFSALLLNDHRRHADTVTHKLEGSRRYFTELATVRGYLGRTYRQNDATRQRIADFLAQDYARFAVTDPETLPSVPAQAKALPSLLMVAPDLSPGGGQVFAISVANEWARRGGRVVLLNVGNLPTHPAMLERISPQVFRLEAAAAGTDLGSLIDQFDIDAIHSGIWWADRWVDSNRDMLPDAMPWVITMHGCHETFLQHPEIDHSFPERMARMVRRASWVYTAEKNLAVFDRYGRPGNLRKIPNGIEEMPVRRHLTRADLDLRPDALVLCLASRGIWEKGWREAVTVTERLNHEGHAVDLLLFGLGPAETALRAEQPANVHLMGQVPSLTAYFEIADIGLLPSCFLGESQPLVLLEMMAQGLPIVASDIGEIADMLGKDDDAAGLLVPVRDGRLDETAFHAALIALLDAGKRRAMSRRAMQRFAARFTIQQMIDSYLPLYKDEGGGGTA